MITLKTNMGEVSARIAAKMKKLQDPKHLVRPVVVDVLSMMTERIHEEGKASDGKQIGTYSNNYLKLRTGNYGNAKKRDAGVYTKGKNKGKPRPKYNRTNDPKVIVSLTRRLENDWGVIATKDGWGIGFLNQQKGTDGKPDSSLKMDFVEQKKGVKIASLTKEELEFAINKFNKLVKKELE